MLITLFWHEDVALLSHAACFNLLSVASKISRRPALSKYHHEQGVSVRERVSVCVLFSQKVSSFHRAIMFSSTPTVASWRYQILARPRGWLGSIPAQRPSQVLHTHSDGLKIAHAYRWKCLSDRRHKQKIAACCYSWALGVAWVSGQVDGPCDVDTPPTNCGSLGPVALEHVAAHWSRQGLTLNGGALSGKLGYSFL